MKKTFAAFAIMLAVGTLAGCASAGNTQLKETTRESLDQKLIQGKTTKQDVRDAFGDPSAVGYTDGGREVWTYVYAHATPTAVSYVPIVNLFSHGADVDKKQLVIMFDKDGILQKFTFSRSQTERRGGIAQ
ncbi:outer membrane protein assembly factor BamE [Burkholderia sp. MBR-1]|uniref:outer membrane protein assembly factor BamE n=1 Tax=Burkholderia sp. MBR-1 TaxID=2732364 RepID=UPI0015EE9177|nr:outer membrane protein assembly factor BamE [Burkholderia sp. MBR-1]QMI49735.1 outer membrane protein assembly factor BamE [Burkholderia sp. MBR-1]